MFSTPRSYAAWARSHRIPIASEPTWNFLEEQLAVYRPKHIVEIGSAVGSTTCRLGKYSEQRGGRVVSFEVSYPTYNLARWRRNKGMHRNVHLFHQDILTADMSLYTPDPIDFVFIDGMKAQYADYLGKIRPYCRSGCCIIMDDVRAYADKMDTLWQYLDQKALSRECIDLDDGDGIVKIVLP